MRREGLLEKMKLAGFNWLALGIESGNAAVRDGVSKSFGQDQIYNSVERIQKAGINVCANYIFGLPEDNVGSMQATLDLAIDLNAEYANFYSCMAYPGSPLYDEAIKEKVPLPSRLVGVRSTFRRACCRCPQNIFPEDRSSVSGIWHSMYISVIQDISR